MFGGKGGLGNLMKQAQQMQDKMQKMQEEIAQLEVTGESGAGLVKVTINGAHNCRRVEIDPRPPHRRDPEREDGLRLLRYAAAAGL